MIISIVILVLLLIFEFLMIWMFLSYWNLLSWSNKIKKIRNKFLELKTKIEKANEQFVAFAKNNNEYKYLETKLANSAIDFENIFHDFEWKSQNLITKINNHKNSHNRLEIKCYFKLKSSFKEIKSLNQELNIKVNSILKFIDKNTKQINFVLPKINFLRIQFNQFNLLVNDLKNIEYKAFFQQSIQTISNEILSLFEHFNEDVFLKYKITKNLEKIKKLNYLIKQLFLIMYESFGCLKIANQLENSFLLSKNKFLENKSNFINSHLENIFSNNEFIDELENIKQTLQLQKQINYQDIKNKIKEIYLQINQARKELNLEIHFYNLFKNNEDKVKYYFDFLMNKYQKNAIEVKNASERDQLKKFVNIDKEKLESQIKNIQNANTTFEKLIKSIDFFKELEIAVDKQIDLEELINLLKDEKEKHCINIEFYHSMLIYFYSQIEELGIALNDIEMKLFEDAMNKINANQKDLRNNEISVLVNLDNELKNDTLDFSNLVVIKIEQAKIIKIVMQKLGPNVIKNNKALVLYQDLDFNYKQNNFEYCIKLINEFIDSEIN